MRKIISILVALGLVLALSAAAAPATGAACNATVVLTNDCAGAEATYNITFTTPVTLQPGNDLLSVDFADGTSLAGVAAADVKVDGNVVSSVTISGTHIEFPVSGAATIFAGSSVEILIEDVINPPDAGAKTLDLDYKLVCCDAVVFDCGEYTIKPAISTYDLVVDFGETYPGIADDFVPPFKACGQNDTGADFNTTLIGSKWYTGFNLSIVTTVVGCNTPCDNVTLSMHLSQAPAGSNVSISINGTFYYPTVSTWIDIGNPIALSANMTESLYSLLHFDTVGDYTICFNVTCPAGQPSCATGCDPQANLLVQKCYDFKVHQWKDADKITLDEKWNLISLPLVPFDTDIDAILAALPAAGHDDLVSIWYYDGCTDDWFVHGNGQTSLTTLEDGKGYWFRMKYPLAGTYTLWVFGTEKPMPPAGPAQYPVCLGWNMFGFTSMTSLHMDNVPAGGYLWNWDAAVDPVVYGWQQGDWMVQGWVLKTFATDSLDPGQGYWGAFPADGFIYVP